ncbi:MAG: hypothetical protein ACLP1D_28690 [Xanthobacteraceae bacterium]
MRALLQLAARRRTVEQQIEVGLGGPVKIGAMMANSIADAARRSVPNCRARRGSQFESLSIMLRILFRFILQ